MCHKVRQLSQFWAEDDLPGLAQLYLTMVLRKDKPLRCFQEDEEKRLLHPLLHWTRATLLPQALQVSGSLCKATVTRSGLIHRKKVQAKIQDANRTFKIADKKGPEPNRHRSGVTEAEGIKSL